MRPRYIDRVCHACSPAIDHRHSPSPDVSGSGVGGYRARAPLGQSSFLSCGRGTRASRQRRPGLTIILTDITQHDESGHRRHIVTHGPGSFMGELAQLAGRPALVDAHAQDEVEALIIPPERLRALLIGEAELGERVMRALILRRVGLLETGAGGPVIVGLPPNGELLRLEGFLRRNGHPYQKLGPQTDADSKALI